MYLLGLKKWFWYRFPLSVFSWKRSTVGAFFSTVCGIKTKKNMTGDKALCNNYWYLSGEKKIQAMPTKQDPWYLLGVHLHP